jgi:O-antigen ligase
VFKYKATHNILVAFGVFLFAWLAWDAASLRARAAWGALALLAAANVLFLVDGATGYLLLGVLALVFVLQRLRGRAVAAALVVGLALSAALAVTPNPVRDRIARIAQEATQSQSSRAATGADSTGVRLEFYRNTLPIVAENPWTGVGTGGFARAYAQQVEGTNLARAANPHSEFLSITVQLGVVGLFVFIVLWWLQWRAARELDTPLARGLMQGLVAAMVVGCTLNSLLLDHTEGLFYAWLSGVLLSATAPMHAYE